MEDRITRIVRFTYAGLIFQILVAVGINLYVLRKEEIEPATIIIPLATVAYFVRIKNEQNSLKNCQSHK